MRGILLLATAHFVTARLGFALHQAHEVASLIWAPTGIAVAVVFLFGRWLWPGIALGGIATVLTSGFSLYLGLWAAIANVTEVLLAVHVLHRLSVRPALDRVRDVLALVVVAIATSLLSASIATGGLALGAEFPADRLPRLWGIWWWGHVSGVLIITPLILTWSSRKTGVHVEVPTRRFEAIILGALIVSDSLVISGWFPGWIGRQIPYYMVPLLVWTGFRFGPLGAALASFGVNTLLVAGTALGWHPYRELADIQSFIAVSAFASMTLSALDAERLRAIRLKASIMRCAIDAIITLDANGRVLEFNPAAERLFGIKAASIVGHPLAPRIVPAELRSAFGAMVQRHLQGGAPETSRFRSLALRGDGTWFPVEVALTRVLVDDQVLVTGFVRDLTVEQTAEAARRESHQLLVRSVDRQTTELLRTNVELERREAMLRRAEALAHLGSFDLDIATSRLEWSDEMFRIYGRDPSSFVPTHDDFLAQVHPEDRMHIASLVYLALRDKKPLEFEERILRPDGTIRILRAQAEVYVDDHGRAARIAGCCQDITDRKQAEVARDRLVELVESSDDAIISLTPDGVIETWNPAAARTFGYRADDIVGRPYTNLVPADQMEEAERTFQLVLSGRHLTHHEMVHERADGSVFDASVTVSPIAESDGRVIGISQVLRDVTEKKIVELQIRTSLSEKELLLREIHHRVKNNLQVISSLLHLQVAQEPTRAGRRRLIDSQSRVQSMALVHQLLYRSTDFAHIDLAEYLQWLATRLVDTYQLPPRRIEVSISTPPIQMDIDRAIPCGLIVNELVTNSLIHAFPGDRHGRIWVTVSEHPGEIVLVVRDDGIGMPSGIGLASTSTLGLQIAQTLTRQLGGTIALSDDSGTTVTITIPNQDTTHAPEHAGLRSPT